MWSTCRSVIRRVHPDLLGRQHVERDVNTESLKALNSALEALKRGEPLAPLELRFFSSDDAGQLQEISVRVKDSLASLYEAFGLITAQEAASWALPASGHGGGLQDVSFLEWLKATVKVGVSSRCAFRLSTRQVDADPYPRQWLNHQVCCIQESLNCGSHRA